MEYKIYSQAGTLKTSFSPGTSTHTHEAMVENVLNLSFTLNEFISLEVNDYIDIDTDRFTLIEAYKPVIKNKRQYQYDVKFYGAESIAKNAQLVDENYEPITSYYDTPAAQLQYIVNCINRVVGSNRYTVGAVVSSAAILVEYSSGSNCFQALTALANAAGTEWWMDGTSFNLTKCEHGETVTLGYGAGLLSLDKEISNDSEFFTRLIPIGSSKNIVKTTYGYKRLQLPGGAKYVDQNVSVYGVKEKIEEEAFADIYPRFTGTVGVVRTEVKTIEGTERTVYYFTDTTMGFNPNDYAVAGLVKHIVFKSGDLIAQDFEANWYPATGEWEIINQYPDESTQVPGGYVIPRAGDTYTIYNIEMPAIYRTNAEAELLAAVQTYLAKYAIDFSIYKGATDHVYLEENNIALTLGRRVKLLSEEYFTSGSRDSRITKITRKLSDLNQMDIEVSNVILKGSYAQLKDDVSNLKTRVDEQLSTEVLNIIKSFQVGDLTDDNVLSSLRVLKEIKNRAISKTDVDTAQKMITFLEGVYFGQYVKGSAGANIDGNGDAEVRNIIARVKATAAELEATNTDTETLNVSDTATTLNLIVNALATVYNLKVSYVATLFETIIKKSVSSDNFVAGTQGMKIYKAVNGDWNMELDNLTVRKIFYLFELVVQKVTHQGGTVIRSAAGGKLTKVTDGGTYWRCEHNSTDDFVANDQILCQTFTGTTIKRYWRLVTSAGAGYFNLSKTDCETNSAIPEQGDTVAVLGNRTIAARQKAQIDCAVGDMAPYRDDYDNINGYSLEDKLILRTGNLSGITDEIFGSLSGSGLYGKNVRLKGDFVLESTGTSISGEIAGVKTSVTALDGKITAGVSEAKTYADNAASTAKQGAIDDAAGKYTTKSYFTAQLEIIATQIAAKVSQSDFDSLGQRVSTAEGSITIMAGQISSKVEKTTVDALTTRVAAAEQKITPEAIISTVSSTIADATANLATKSEVTQTANSINLSLYAGQLGKNLLRNTDYVLEGVGVWVDKWFFFGNNDAESLIFAKTLRGKNIALSVNVNIESVTAGYGYYYVLQLKFTDDTQQECKVSGTTVQTTRLTGTFAIQDKEISAISLNLMALQTGIVGKIYNPKVELGTIATSWTNSPDDKPLDGINLIPNSENIKNISQKLVDGNVTYDVLDKDGTYNAAQVSFTKNGGLFRIGQADSNSILKFTGNTYTYSAWVYPTVGTQLYLYIGAISSSLINLKLNTWQLVSFSQTLKDSDWFISGGKAWYFVDVKGVNSGDTFKVYHPKLEIGYKATEWNYSPKDLVSKEGVISSINLSPESIKISADKIILDGETIAKLINAQTIISKILKTATDGPRVEVYGSLLNIYGNFANPNIQFGVNAKGQSVLSYFDNNGNKLYDLGPQGFDWGSIVPASWSSTKLTKICNVQSGDTIPSWGAITSQALTSLKNVTASTGSNYYQYYAGSNPTLTDADRVDEKYLFVSESVGSSKIIDGWYARSTNGHLQYMSDNTQNWIKPEPGAIYEYTAGVRDQDPIYMDTIVEYIGGIPVREINIFWNELII